MSDRQDPQAPDPAGTGEEVGGVRLGLVKTTRSTLALWLLAVVLAVLLRIPGLADRGPWLDERVSLAVAMGLPFDRPVASGRITPVMLWADCDWPSVIRANQASNAGNSVAYALLLHGWLRWFGPSDLSARSLSLVFGLGILILVHLLGRRVAGSFVGGLGTLCCAVHPLAIRYSQEIRAYALATFLTLAATYVLWTLLAEETSGRRLWRWGLYAFLCVLAFLSHWLVIPVLGGHFVLVCLARKRELWTPYLGAMVLVGVLLLPWWVTCGEASLADVATRSATYRREVLAGNPEYWWVHPATPRYVIGGALGASLAMFGYVIPAPRIALAAAALLVPLLLLFFLGRTRVPSGWWKLGLLPALGLLFAVASSLRAGHDLPFQGLYFNFYVPLVMVVIASAWASLRKLRPTAAQGLAIAQLLLVGISLASSWPGLLDDRRPNAYAAIARAIHAEVRATRVALPTWSDAQMLCFYLGHTEGPEFVVTEDGSDRVQIFAASGGLLRELAIDRKKVR